MALSASSVLHYWTARYGVVPVIGGKPTHSRNSAGRWIDQQGVLQSAIVNTPRMGWATISGERRQIMTLEQARTNATLWSSDFSNAAWTTVTAITVATGKPDPTGGNGACTLTATASPGDIYQQIGISASIGRTNSLWVRRRTGTGAVNLFDAAGSLSPALTLTSQWQRFSVFRAAQTARYIGLRVSTSGDAVDVFLAQQDDAASMSSEIATTSAAVTRAADSFNWGYSPKPQAKMVYIRFVERGAISAIGSGGLFGIGKSDGSKPAYGVLAFPVGQYSVYYYDGISNVASSLAGGPSVGDVVEIVTILEPGVVVDIYQSINGAAVTAGGRNGGLTLPATWSDTALFLNSYIGAGSVPGLNDFAEIKIVKYADVVGATAADRMTELRAFELGPNGMVL